MRFVVITKATTASEAGRPATTDDIATMGAFIEDDDGRPRPAGT